VAEPSDEPCVPLRWRPYLVGAILLSGVMLVAAMGVVSPASGGMDGADLRARIVRDLLRLRAAVADYSLDTGEAPPAVFDLGGAYAGGLLDADCAPFAVREAWRGPYLPGPMARPTPASFWSLAEPRRQLDRDGDGAEDEVWARLHRGHGEIDDALAAWCDQVLDDGAPGRGAVRVTPAWIWFQLLER
jgi:hypothetical protein